MKPEPAVPGIEDPEPTPARGYTAFLAPRFWGTWIVVLALWICAHLPYVWGRRLGEALGLALYPFMGRRRHIAKVNLRLCFPDLSPQSHRALLVRSFRSLGLAFVEMGLAWWAPASRLQDLARPVGLEHLQAALAKGKGVILLSAHFTTFEIGLRLLTLHVPCHMMYRAHKNPLFEKIMHDGRARHLEKVFHREQVRTMLASLRANRPVWYAPDQDYGRRHSVFVPFFDQPAATVTTTARFARLSAAPVVPFFQHRLPGSAGYELVILPALRDFPSGDDERDTRRISALLEAEIRRSPDQYLWVHRRFKTRAVPNDNVYTQ